MIGRNFEVKNAKKNLLRKKIYEHNAKNFSLPLPRNLKKTK